MQDSIVAEDLGRFPDANVADSLSHITGITISRTRGGEGQYVSVRGLGPEYSIVTLNGRILATDGDGREFAFDVLPSEVISGADVYKSADASHLEGSIGGTINLSSAKPLDQAGMHTAFLGRRRLQRPVGEERLQGQRRVQQHFRRRHRWACCSRLPTRTSRIVRMPCRSSRINPDSPGSFDANEDGEISAARERSAGPVLHELRRAHPEQEAHGRHRRIAVEAERHVQHQRRCACSRASMRRPSVITSPTIVEDSILDEDTGLHRWSDVSIDDHWVNGMTVAELVPEISTITEYRVVDTTQFGWNAQWQATDKLGLQLRCLSLRSSMRDSGGKDTWVVSGIARQSTPAAST